MNKLDKCYSINQKWTNLTSSKKRQIVQLKKVIYKKKIVKIITIQKTLFFLRFVKQNKNDIWLY